MRAQLATSRSEAGFTLIELVITIAVGSVVVAFMALFIVSPMNAYSAQTRRAALVDASDSALRFMARDLRSALPNSVRTRTSGSVTALELLATADGARYQDNGPVANPALALDFTAADGAFATTVPFTQVALPFASTSYYLVIYNVGVPGANAYEMLNVITPARTAIAITAGSTANQDLVTLTPPFQFAYGSPEKRVYLVSGPVSYLCDTSAGTLTRYSSYAIQLTEPNGGAALAAAGATSALVASNVSACTFTYTPGTAQRNSLVTLTIQISQSGEAVQLLNEVQVVNAP
jgi:MSHA biogenesis protein MshO